MDSVPFTVLRSILLPVKLQGKGCHSDLLACSLVSRAWHHAAIPLLYGIIALDVPLLKTFTQDFAIDKYGGYILSLTLRMEGDLELTRHPSGAQLPHPQLRQRLQSVAAMIPKMKNLASFSVKTSAGYCIISRQDLMVLLDSLSPACTSLEIDTRDIDICTLDGELQGTGHICASLRRLLPQLVHLRLRTRTMCPALFHARIPEKDIGKVQPEMLSADGFVPMPSIRSTLIICGQAYVGLNDRCGTHETPQFMKQPEHFAWTTITRTIERMLAVSTVDDSSVSNSRVDMAGRDTRHPGWLRDPESVKFLVIGHTDHDDHDKSVWAAVIRANMLNEESWAIPIRQIWHGEIPERWVVRLPDGQEILGTGERVQELAADESENWLSLFDGARLPRRILSLSEKAANGRSMGPAASLAELSGGFAGVRPDVPSLKTPEEWHQAYPRKSATHWKNERIYGKRLVSAEKRVGRDDYTSLRLISELAVEGERYD